MKTLQEMLASLRRKVQDNRLATEDLTEMLEEAADSLWNDLAADHRGRRCLRVYGAATALVANQEEYALPADCLRLDLVEVRATSTALWRALSKSAPPAGGEGITAGSEILFAPAASLAASASGWFDDTAEGFIRIWPSPPTADGQQYRLRYFQKPVFPTADTGTFNDPAAGGTPVRALPDGVEIAAVYLAAGLFGFEELEDGRPIGAFGQLYRAKLAELCGGPAGGRTGTDRRFILQTRVS